MDKQEVMKIEHKYIEKYCEMAKEFGAGLVYAEMVSDKGLAYKNDKTLKMVEIGEKIPIHLRSSRTDHRYSYLIR